MQPRRPILSNAIIAPAGHYKVQPSLLMKIQSVASLLTIFLSASIVPWSQESPPASPTAFSDGFTNTPIVPGTTWHVHDPARPQPQVVTPGDFSTQESPGKPPS